MSVSSLYTREDSAVTRMRKALVWNFEQVKVTNGYRNTLGTVLTEVVDPSQATAFTFPLLVLVRGDTEIENEDQSEQLWHKRIRYLAMVFLARRRTPRWRARRCCRTWSRRWAPAGMRGRLDAARARTSSRPAASPRWTATSPSACS
jgi:hypothetical protein